MEKVKDMIENDPKKHMYDIDSPYHILNRLNTHGQSPLYVAAKHGHLDMMILLIKLGADPKIPSILENDELETILEVSVRWSHVQIAAYLLKNFKHWSKINIVQAFQHVCDDTDNPALRNLLISYSRAHFGKIYTWAKLGGQQGVLCCFSTPSNIVAIHP